MIAKEKTIGWLLDSPNFESKKCIGNSAEIMHSDIRIYRVYKAF